MKEANTIDTVAQYLLTTKNFNLRSGVLYEGQKRAAYIARDVIEDDDKLDELGIFREVKSRSFDKKEFLVAVANSMKDILGAEAKAKQAKLLGSDVPKLDPMKFLVFKDMESPTDFRDQDKFLVDSETFAMVDSLSISAYRHLIGEEVYNEIRPKFPLVKRKYEPYLINTTTEDKKWEELDESLGCEITCINTCIQPKWRYERDLSQKLTAEEIFFIESSFVDKESLQYYIDAAYHTIIDKMWSYIMLYGVKGTGKTTLIEMIIPCVGTSNYRKAPQNALKKEFNGFKKNKRLVLMDEMVADTNTAINILKSDANKEFNVEEKSKETEAVKNFVSMWIATNNISDWKFTYDERRFSVLELTKETTEERGIKDSWMSAFTLRIETEEWANAFFNYLEANKSDTFNTMSPYKSEAFFQVVYESLKPWEMKIVDEVTNGEKTDEISIASLYDESDRFQPTTHKKLIDFLDNYRHRGEKLGEYKRGRSVRNSFIIPSEKYRLSENKMELK